MRLLLAAIALVVAAGLVAACSGSDAPEDAATSSDRAGPDGAASEVEADDDAEAADDADADTADDAAQARDEDAADEEPARAEPDEAEPDETGAGDPEDTPTEEAQDESVALSVVPLPYDNDNALRVLEVLSVTIGGRVQATDGERAAAAFLAAEFESLGYAVELQPVPLESLRVDEFRVLVNGRPVVAEVLHGSAGGDLSAPLVVVPGMGAAEDFAAVDVEGAVALVERGQVFFRQKVANAAGAGAIAVLIYNNEPGPFPGTLGETSAIPAVSISQAQGRALKTLVTRAQRAAETAETTGATDDTATQVTVEVLIRYDPLSEESQNVVARRPDGACRIWVGGHYDSVPGVMGANDNASGTALVVEMARAYADSAGGRLICFVAFGAEESVRGSPGILGSKVFVQRLVESGAIEDVTAMLNLDVAAVGSALLLVGVEPLVGLAEEVGAALEIDLAAGALPPGIGSDHLNFAQAGVPVIFPTVLGGPIHVPADRFEAVEPERLASVGRLAHGLLGCLIASLEPALAEACVVETE